MASQQLNEPVEGGTSRDTGALIEELKAELARLTEQVQNYLQERATGLRDSAIDTADNVETLIRENPLPAVGIAMGTGFILGLLIRRGQPDRWKAPRLSRRDIDRLASRFTESLAAARSRAGEAATGAGDSALLERLAGLLGGLLESSKETATSVGSAGERAARSVAAMGEKTARGIANRLSVVTR